MKFLKDFFVITIALSFSISIICSPLIISYFFSNGIWLLLYLPLLGLFIVLEERL